VQADGKGWLHGIAAQGAPGFSVGRFEAASGEPRFLLSGKSGFKEASFYRIRSEPEGRDSKQAAKISPLR